MLGDARQRENWYEAEKAAYRAENWEGVVYYGRKALCITTKSRSAINEAEAWGAAPWDLLSIGLWHTGDIRGAAEAASTALSLCRSERIEANLRLSKKGWEKHEEQRSDSADGPRQAERL